MWLANILALIAIMMLALLIVPYLVDRWIDSSIKQLEESEQAIQKACKESEAAIQKVCRDCQGSFDKAVKEEIGMPYNEIPDDIWYTRKASEDGFGREVPDCCELPKGNCEAKEADGPQGEEPLSP